MHLSVFFNDKGMRILIPLLNETEEEYRYQFHNNQGLLYSSITRRMEVCDFLTYLHVWLISKIRSRFDFHSIIFALNFESQTFSITFIINYYRSSLIVFSSLISSYFHDKFKLHEINDFSIFVSKI